MMGLFTWGLTHSRKVDDATEGIKALVWLYYDNYTDAEELEPRFVRNLQDLADYLDPDMDEDVIEAAVREAEAELRASGRRVHTAACDEIPEE